MLDGEPIVAIATITTPSKANSKTGAMVQTWILRADLDPVIASRIGADASICGQCRHRGEYNAPDVADGAVRVANGTVRVTDGAVRVVNGGGQRIDGTRSCYVQLYVPQNVWRTAKRGNYDNLCTDLGAAAERIADLPVRLGAYGDPAAVPIGVWQSLLSRCTGFTGYTHQWRDYPEFSAFVMASCDTSEERVHARALGFRTFRVAPAAGWSREAGEVLCPASAEAGKKTTCIACKACGGHAARARADIVIPAHGNGRKLINSEARI